jgi:hypothetical protein
MTTNNTAHDGESFIIPACTLRGSKRDMVEDIDQAIIGLLALRHLIDGTAPPPEALARRDRGQPASPRRRWPRLLAGRRPVSFWI